MSGLSRMASVVALIGFLFTSTTINAQKTFAEAIDLNDYFSGITDSLYEKGRLLGTAIVEGVKTKNFSGIQPAKKKIIAYTESTQAEVRKIKDQFGSEQLRFAMISFLEFEIDFVKNRIPLLDKLNAKSTEAEIRAAIDQMIEASEAETEILKTVRAMQESFAAKNGFAIEPADESGED